MAAARDQLAGPGRSLFALDFDGTLTEIVDDPEAPRLTPARRAILSRIPSSHRSLTIVSGRSLIDLKPRIGIEQAIYVGNHGIEMEGPGIPEKELSPELQQSLAHLIDHLPLEEGTFAENKGCTATLHVRPRGDLDRHRDLARAIRAAVEGAGFELRPGKASWEIRPAGGATKGDALLRLLSLLPGASRARTLYIGDDRTDEDAFRAIDGGVTVRVGSGNSDTAARFSLPDPVSVYDFIERLLER